MSSQAIGELRIGPGEMLVLLNGASSSGKSSTATALVARMGDETVHLDIDTFVCAGYAEPTRWPAAFNFRQAFYLDAARQELQRGRSVVLEYIFREQVQRDEVGKWFTGLPVVWIHLYCPLEELVRREGERGDRRPGLSAAQFPLVEAVTGWDLVIDTSRLSNASERAERILNWLVSRAAADG